MFCKVGEAVKKINDDDSVREVHPLTDEIKDILQANHPKARDAEQDIILPQHKISPERFPNHLLS